MEQINQVTPLERRLTLLGVGPMSLNCVESAVELANEYSAPLFLIASRRQIDSEEFGGGYVNKWTTGEFANYVRSIDKKNKIILARDHGGPWQNEKEILNKLNLKDAMASAKRSYKADIESGFSVIHIDTSIDIHTSPSIDELLERMFELYEYCWSESLRTGVEIAFEIGTEEQTGGTNSQDELRYTLNSMAKYCQRSKLPKPRFVVIQSGTRVMEMRNVGSFDTPIRVANEIPSEIQVPKMIEICNEFNVMMKEHNTDYLSDEALHWHPRLGIHAANVAPEFGVCETKAFYNFLLEHQLFDFADKFIELSYESNKWKKWMLPDTKATKIDKAMIAGHYIFSTREFLEMKAEVQHLMLKKQINIDNLLKHEIKKSILRYMKKFRLVE
jgi:tagatose-1,6-bisphosphate aldolase non-catalytic subunit AgaZ/GatZ